jgi:hypothetical protein
LSRDELRLMLGPKICPRKFNDPSALIFTHVYSLFWMGSAVKDRSRQC